MNTNPRLNTNRTPINMVHGSDKLKVSHNEASRASEVAMRRLLKSRRLSLVVDLDQTIIHAVCDPTVGEWQMDESNPNHAAVKDVESFELMDEGPNARPCSYYIKMRPGLKRFLSKMSEKYELHIYTMGTRSYAQNVAKIVDPDGKIFGDRILSRDESGSMIAKSLHRLFPVDTKMVVIIDDRADVWNWSRNLIRVKAFNFYVGIGDINSSFLPKLNDGFNTAKPEDPATSTSEDGPAESIGSGVAGTKPEGGDIGTLPIDEQLVLMAGKTDPSTIEKQSHEHADQIAAQVHDRPLLKQQEELDKEDEETESKESASDETRQNGPKAPEKNGNQENGLALQRPSVLPLMPHPAHRHPLLRDDDDELIFLEKSLDDIHEAFFSDYERNLASVPGGRVAELRGEKGSKKQLPRDDSDVVPDVKYIMPRMKEEVLKGVVICFTGVIPQGIPHAQ
jgi:RNA polymerase II subunit A-like phosphatase